MREFICLATTATLAHPFVMQDKNTVRIVPNSVVLKSVCSLRCSYVRSVQTVWIDRATRMIPHPDLLGRAVETSWLMFAAICVCDDSIAVTGSLLQFIGRVDMQKPP